MHLNRKKIKQSKFRISPTISKKKKIKKTKKRDINKTLDVNKKNVKHKRSKRKNSRVKITTAISNANSLSKKKFNNKLIYKPMSKWKNILKGHVIFILGNAPSISKQNLNLLDPYFTIGVNRIYYAYTPTILLWQDIQMWNNERKNIIKQKSLKVSSKSGDPRKIFLNFSVRVGNFKFGKDPSTLCGRGNTTALACQLAISLGCSDIVLLGTDCKYGVKGKTDFYGKNEDHKSYTLKMCKNSMSWLKDNCPVPIYNCSKNKLWSEEKLPNVIKKLNPKKMSMKKYLNMFKK